MCLYRSSQGRATLSPLITLFSGALVPSQFYREDKRVQSALIEVNRCLYMDESTGTKSGRFDEIRNGLSEVLSMLSQTEHREMDENSEN